MFPLRIRRALSPYRLCTAPFWLSTEHLWTSVTPFWLSTDDMYTCIRHEISPRISADFDIPKKEEKKTWSIRSLPKLSSSFFKYFLSHAWCIQVHTVWGRGRKHHVQNNHCTVCRLVLYLKPWLQETISAFPKPIPITNYPGNKIFAWSVVLTCSTASSDLNVPRSSLDLSLDYMYLTNSSWILCKCASTS